MVREGFLCKYCYCCCYSSLSVLVCDFVFPHQKEYLHTAFKALYCVPSAKVLTPSLLAYSIMNVFNVEKFGLSE